MRKRAIASVLACLAAAAAVSAQAVTVVDALGRSVTLDKPAEKIIGTHNPSLNTGIVLGGGDRYLAGFGNKKMADRLYDFVMADYAGIPQIGMGATINLETVAKLGPGVVAILPERFKGQVDEYAKVGVKAIVALPNQESFDGIKNSLLIVGKALGADGRAQEIAAFIDGRVGQAKALSAKAAKRPSVLFLGSKSPFSVATSSMIQTDIIEMAGGTNAVAGVDVKGAFADVNLERIIAWNPEVIWVPAYASYTVESILADPKWRDVRAVKANAVYRFPSSLEPWDYPTASAALGLCWGLYSLHPELFSLAELQAQSDAFYALVYGKKFTLEQHGVR